VSRLWSIVFNVFNGKLTFSDFLKIFYGQSRYLIIPIYFIQRWENVQESSKQRLNVTHRKFLLWGTILVQLQNILRDKSSPKRENVTTSRSASNPDEPNLSM